MQGIKKNKQKSLKEKNLQMDIITIYNDMSLWEEDKSRGKRTLKAESISLGQSEVKKYV